MRRLPHVVVHFEAKMSRFPAIFQDDVPDHSGPLPMCQAAVSNVGHPSSTAISFALSKTRTQLRPSRKS